MKRVIERVGEVEPHPTVLLIEEMMQAQRREWRVRVGLVLGSLSAALVILAAAVVAHLAD
jgi:hypothetical protein